MPADHECENGWVRVSDEWVRRQVALLPADYPEDMRASKAAALADTWYPCRECEPVMFARWVQGHLASDHDRVACEECRPASGRPRSRRPARMAVEDRPPHPVMGTYTEEF